MHRDSCQRLLSAIVRFLRCRKGVAAIEYAVLAVVLIAIIAVVFNPSSGPLYDVMVQAKDSMVTALEESTGS